MLFNSTDPAEWNAALALYPEAFKALAATKSDQSIIALDKWFQTEFPALLASRSPQYITHDEIVQLVAWKLKRGKYRPALAKMVGEHADTVVRRTSQEAFKLVHQGDLKAGITKMSELKGVGPATASAILCAGAPDKVPFMADESVDSVPGLGKIAYNLAYYLKFAAKVIDKAAQLKKVGGDVNTPHMVELALWADMMTDKFDLPRPSVDKQAQKQNKTEQLAASAAAPTASGNKRKAIAASTAPLKTKETDDSTTNKRARSTRSSTAKK
ncbi:MAG: hypothetical protein J3R72DRAFT_489484 [Linnemannia gamsii]|nr:MAG: hypothetical protein J3R72DRAFT_489484 [Linnemannia gamsii]